MRKRVAIIGASQTRFEKEKAGQSLYEMIFEVARGALRDAGLERKDLESIVLAASDLVDGISISSMVTATAAGALLKDEIKVADDGIFGLALAFMRIMSGDFGNSIVVSWSKCSQGPIETITNLNFDPLFHRDFALNHITASAIQAGTYMHHYGVKRSQAAQVAVKNRSNALKNDKACLKQAFSLKEALESPLLSTPLTRTDMSAFCDGACALVLADQSQAGRSDQSPVWISGIGWSADSYYLGDRDLSRLTSLSDAARRAYNMAGLDDPVDEIDVAEVYDWTSYHELMAYEALGFCGPGEGGVFMEAGSTLPGGRIPVNPSGGLLASNPYFASGLVRACEAAIQVRGQAGERQIQGARRALAHGSGGMAGQKNCVVVMEG